MIDGKYVGKKKKKKMKNVNRDSQQCWQSNVRMQSLTRI